MNLDQKNSRISTVKKPNPASVMTTPPHPSVKGLFTPAPETLLETGTSRQQDDQIWVKTFSDIGKQNDEIGSAIKRFRQQLQLVRQRISSLQDKIEQHPQNMPQTKKKNRRTALQIQRKYNCPFATCGRQYGSQVSLNLHLKIKHGGKGRREQINDQNLVNV